MNRLMLLACSAVIAGCVPPSEIPSPVTAGVRAHIEGRPVIEGRIVEARCYFNTGSIDGDHIYCAYSAARANLPLILLTAEGEVIYLSGAPARLADYVTARVRVTGRLSADRQLMSSESLSVWHDQRWQSGPL